MGGGGGGSAHHTRTGGGGVSNYTGIGGRAWRLTPGLTLTQIMYPIEYTQLTPQTPIRSPRKPYWPGNSLRYQCVDQQPERQAVQSLPRLSIRVYHRDEAQHRQTEHQRHARQHRTHIVLPPSQSSQLLSSALFRGFSNHEQDPVRREERRRCRCLRRRRNSCRH